MKSIQTIAIGAFLSITMIVQAQTAATLTDVGTVAPEPGGHDISQLSTSGQMDLPDKLNYYDDQQVNTENVGEPGQTFKTGGGAAGYTLTSLAIKTGGGTTSGTGTPQGYLLHVYSVSGDKATVIATYTATNFTYADGDWLRWSGFNLKLDPNAVYAFSFGKAVVGGWEAMGNASPNPYPGGELALLPVAGGTITFGGSHNHDAVFDIGLTVN